MKLVNSNVSNFARLTLACVLGSTLLSVPALSNAASKTLTLSGTPATSVAVGAD